MAKRSRRSTADEEEWDPTSRPKPARPTLKDLSDSDSSQATKRSATPVPRKGGRSRVACDQCSKRRSRCSLEGPACEGCVERGDPEGCSYQSLIWIQNVDDLPSRQLRRKLDALEALLRKLSSEKAHAVSSRTPSPVERPVRIPVTSPPSEFAINSVSASLASSRDSLARSLFFNGTLNNQHLPEAVFLANLHLELRQLDNSHYISTSQAASTGSTSLPTPQQAHLAICFFSSAINPTFRLIYEPVFFRECQEFWANGTVHSSIWLSLYLAVCASGLRVVLGDEEAMKQSGLAEDEVQRLAGLCWTESRDILDGEGFPIASSLESIQIAITLSLASLHGSSSNIARSSSLIRLAVSAAVDTGLNIDPREGSVTGTPLGAEMRRRTFWALYTCEAMFDLIVGDPCSIPSSSTPSVRRPLFLSNDCYLVSGNLSPIGVDATTRPLAISPTSYIFTVAVLSRRVTELLQGDGTDIENQLNRVLDEMDSFDGAFHASPVAEAMFRAACIRLSQAASELNVSSRGRAAVAAKHLDGLLRSAVAPCPELPPDLLFFSTSLSMTTALRSCLVLYDGQIAFERDRPDLRNFSIALSNSCRTPYLRLSALRCASILSRLTCQTRRSSLEATPSLVGSSLATPSSENNYLSPAISASAQGPELPLRMNLPLPILAEHYQAEQPTFLPFIDDHGPHGTTESEGAMPYPVQPIPRPLAAAPRPLLTLRTSVAASADKPATPTFSPWQDTSQTPSRYIGYTWNQPNLF